MSRLKLTLALVAALFAVAAPTAAAAPGSYVGLGDSYAAGPLIPLQILPSAV